MNIRKIPDEEIIEKAMQYDSMLAAANSLNINYKTFIRKAKKLGVFRPNRSGKGIPKNKPYSHTLEQIFNGECPQYQTYKLKIRLIEEGYKEDKCEICGWSEKLYGMKYSPCELHHRNGNPTDHRLENLMILCPNCHSLTETFRLRGR